jgi:hypothetical protein
VRDGFRRHLIVLANDTFATDSGLSDLVAVADEVSLVVDAFAAMGYGCDDDHRIVNQPSAVAHRRIIALLAGMGPDDVVAIYVTSHGEIVGAGGAGTLVIHGTDSRAGRKAGTLTVSSLLEGLYEREFRDRLRNLLLILDVCHAGMSIDTVVREVRSALPVWPEEPGTPTGVSVVAVTGAEDAAEVSLFARSWRDAICEANSVPRSCPYLDLPELLDQVQAGMGTQAVEPVSLHRRGAEVCLPNPRHHLDGVEPEELDQWWEPVARALPQHGAGSPWRDEAPRWLFTGRQRVNTRIAQWLAGAADDRVLVLTGAPGSGKSTILARFVVLTVPDLRRQLVAQGVEVLGAEAPPEGFTFTAAISASRMSTAELFARVAQALGLSTRAELHNLSNSPAHLRDRAVATILVDALDEADNPHDAVIEVLRPLVQAARAGSVRLIVATREHPVGHDPADPGRRRGDLISPLLGEQEPTRVDSPDWLAIGDIARYCERILSVPRNDAGRANPYATSPKKRRILARAIEERAHHSFLLAAIVARMHTLDAACVDPTGSVWREQFPEHLGDAMRQELRALHGYQEAARQLDLLRPLAFAEGAGLSRDRVGGSDLWAALATALCAGRYRFDGADVDQLLGQRSATHLISQLEAADRLVYRFHHEALAEALRPGSAAELVAAHATVTAVLLGTLDGALGRDWAAASPYPRRALPWHARHSGQLSDLAEQAGFLAHVDPDRLNSALAAAEDGRARTIGALLRPYVHRLRELRPVHRAFLLALAAMVVGERGLANGLFEVADLGIEVTAARARPEPQRQVLLEGRSVEALVATRDRWGAPLLFLGNGRYVDVREPDSGMVVDSMLAGGEVTSMLCLVDDDGFPVVATSRWWRRAVPRGRRSGM